MNAKQYPSTSIRWVDMPVVEREEELLIGGWQVMQAWEWPIMETMAMEVAADGGDILEIGFGMGIAASAIMACGCRSYTVIEAHPQVVQRCRTWARQYDGLITIKEGFWEEIVPQIGGQFDGILFDTYPLCPDERGRNHLAFIPIAPGLLRPGGVLTYYSDETLEFRSEHLKLLLTHFADVRLIRIDGLQPFANCEYWNNSVMIVPVARKVSKS